MISVGRLGSARNRSNARASIRRSLASPDPRDVPAEADELRGDVVAEGQGGAALDRDLVVVVDPAEVVQLQVPGQRRRLLGDALHHAAVPADGVDVEVEQLEAGAVERRRHPLRGHGHADAGGVPRAQRAGRALHPGRPAVLGVPRALRVQLAEPLDVIEADRRLAERLVLRVDRLHPGQVQQRVQQGRGVPGGEHEPVAVGPDRHLGVEAQVLLPQGVGDRGQGDGRPRVPGVGRLHGVHRQRPHGGDGEVVGVGDAHGGGHRCSVRVTCGCAGPRRRRRRAGPGSSGGSRWSCARGRSVRRAPRAAAGSDRRA